MATLLDEPEDWICDRPGDALDAAVRRLGAVVSLRDAETRTAGPGTAHYVDPSGHGALGTSGSGDVLAGALLGLAARGADPLCATVWAAHLHGLAGQRLGCDGPGLGTLARELPAELPRALRSVQRSTVDP
jgi:NAD(P)H-hydrate repair Nnr-like enzyme with NAD(P)H-hydrate dehydratase domain